jgi:hypothetical protein
MFRVMIDKHLQHLSGLYLRGVCLIGVHLIGVYLTLLIVLFPLLVKALLLNITEHGLADQS